MRSFLAPGASAPSKPPNFPPKPVPNAPPRQPRKPKPPCDAKGAA
jgi:hypothetical protein